MQSQGPLMTILINNYNTAFMIIQLETSGAIKIS